MTGVTIDSEAIRALANILDETGLSEIEWAEGDCRIRVVRNTGSTMAVLPAAAPVPMARGAAGPCAPADLEPASINPLTHPGAIKSPMVGTAYLSPEPGERPFVQVGDTVVSGQTVLIIEAMKVMNPIKAHRAGVVREILIENEQPVEFGEPLLIID